MTTNEQTPTVLPALPAVVELSGRVAPDLADYVQHKLAVVLRHTGRTALSAHVRVVRHEDPARERPASARATIALAGIALNAHADGATPREAVDLMLDRLDRRIARTDRNPRRGPRPPAVPAEPVVTDDDRPAFPPPAGDVTG